MLNANVCSFIKRSKCVNEGSNGKNEVCIRVENPALNLVYLSSKDIRSLRIHTHIYRVLSHFVNFMFTIVRH